MIENTQKIKETLYRYDNILFHLSTEQICQLSITVHKTFRLRKSLKLSYQLFQTLLLYKRPVVPEVIKEPIKLSRQSCLFGEVGESGLREGLCERRGALWERWQSGDISTEIKKSVNGHRHKHTNTHTHTLTLSPPLYSVFISLHNGQRSSMERPQVESQCEFPFILSKC